MDPIFEILHARLLATASILSRCMRMHIPLLTDTRHVCADVRTNPRTNPRRIRASSRFATTP